MIDNATKYNYYFIIKFLDGFLSGKSDFSFTLPQKKLS